MTRDTDSRQTDRHENERDDSGAESAGASESEGDDAPGEQCELSVFDSVHHCVPSERLTTHRRDETDDDAGCDGEADGSGRDCGGESDA